MSQESENLPKSELEICTKAGFNIQSVQLHRKRVLHFLGNRIIPRFSILDTCRIDNGAIRQLVPLSDRKPSGFLAFIPAAGAASRYHVSILQLTGKEAPLVPKALLPAVREGQTFLELKLEEHRQTPGLVGQVFVAAAGQSSAFEAVFSDLKTPNDPPILLIEQDATLSTVRFSESGEMLLEENGAPSIVPAGHGALAQLFPQCAKFFPTAHSLFIRNVDNVCGTKAKVIHSTTQFLAFHQDILEAIRQIRIALSQDDWTAAATQAKSLCSFFSISLDPVWSSERILRELLSALFHTPPFLLPCHESSNASSSQTRESIRRLYGRPVNVLGMVPNSGKDVGGTPVSAQTPFGKIDLCIEVCHAAPEDHVVFLSDSAKATHFNPVFVAAELPKEETAYESEAHPFWTIAEKKYQNIKVLYHETLLYELMGNGVLSNCIFVEIPRILFNPHKTVQDALGRSILHWR